MYRIDEIETVLDQLPARLIATTPVASRQAASRCGDAWEWMQPSARDIWTVVVDDADVHSYAQRSDDWAGSSVTLGTVAKPVPKAAVLDEGASLREAVDALAKHPFCLLGTGPTFIITAADLGKPAGSLWAFGLILSFEDALTRLFPSLSEGLWRKDLSEEALAAHDGEVDRRRTKGTFITEEHCLSLSQKSRFGEKYIAPLLGVSSNSWRKKTCGSLQDIRNDLAHGRPLGTSHPKGPQGAMTRLLRLRIIVRQLWGLVDDRAHVWAAYQATLIELDDPRPAGPFWMLSAQNPAEETLSDSVNSERHEALCHTLRRLGHLGGEGWGRSPAAENAWRERMAVMVDGSDELACSISTDFGQRSAFRIESGELVVLDAATGAERGRRVL